MHLLIMGPWEVVERSCILSGNFENGVSGLLRYQGLGVGCQSRSVAGRLALLLVHTAVEQ